MRSIIISPKYAIPWSEVSFKTVLAGGPGGQHVNKVASAVQLQFDISSSSLPPDIRDRLMTSERNRITKDGVLLIKVSKHRSQHRNKVESISRLVTIIRASISQPTKSRASKPTVASKMRRRKDKMAKSAIKKMRQPPRPD